MQPTPWSFSWADIKPIRMTQYKDNVSCASHFVGFVWENRVGFSRFSCYGMGLDLTKVLIFQGLMEASEGIEPPLEDLQATDISPMSHKLLCVFPFNFNRMTAILLLTSHYVIPNGLRICGTFNLSLFKATGWISHFV
jgi:hypothetical protein